MSKFTDDRQKLMEAEADEFVTLIVQLRAERDRYSGALTDIARSTSKWTDCAAIARAALTEEDA